jgi:hypothetical protein
MIVIFAPIFRRTVRRVSGARFAINARKPMKDVALPWGIEPQFSP